jgi:hypothetical protein
MKQRASEILIVIGIIMLIPLWSGGEDTLPSPMPIEQLDKNQTNALPSAVMPCYQPPKGAQPGGRLKERGRSGKLLPVVQVLAPNHVGVTLHKQPTLYWYISKPSTYPIEFTLVDSRKILPIIETRLPSPVEAGIQAIRLKDFGITLDVEVPYRWFVAVVVDESNPTKDITAGAIIERVSFIEGIVIHSANEEDPAALAKDGLWYDAIKAISSKIEASPKDPFYRQQRASLLEQVGLPDIAEYDLRQSRKP